MVSQFATAIEHITESYNFVMDSTDVPAELREALLPPWVYVQHNGDPKLHGPALGILGEFKWAWKPFEEWQETFKRAGRWPYMWESLGIPDLVKRDSQWKLRQARVRILAHTLAVSAYRCRDFHNGQPSYLAQRGWSLTSIGCPVEDEIAEAMKDSVRLDNWHTWPPFFPGDRGSLEAEPRKAR